MTITEPVQAAIWQCLNQHQYNDAMFLSERLHAELHSDESLFLLATSYYRAGKLKAAKILLNESTHPQCRYLLAKCCIEFGEYGKAEGALVGTLQIIASGAEVIEYVCKNFGDSSSFALNLLGEIYKNTRRTDRAYEVYTHSLRLNPCLWSSFEALVALGHNPDPQKVFVVGNNDLVLHNLVSTPLSSNSVLNVLQCKDNVNRNEETSATEFNSSVITGDLSGIKEMTPEVHASVSSPPTASIADPPGIMITPIFSHTSRGSRLRDNHLTPSIPTFGTMLYASSAYLTPDIPGHPGTVGGTTGHQEQSPLQRTSSEASEAAPLKRTKKINQLFGQGSSATTPATSTGLVPRRSTRLFTSNSIKENTSKTSSSPRSPRTLLSNRSPNKKKSQDNKPITKSPAELIDELNKTNDALSQQQSVVQLQRTSLNGLMQLLQMLAKAHIHFSHFKCKQAIETLQSLPPHQYDTGFVLSMLGQAHFELRDYDRSNETFEHLMKLYPFYLNGLEYYSSSLWHKMLEKKLSYLANFLVDLDPNAPQTLCALGNCFSRQKMHNSAVECLEKACKLYPKFLYAHTLLGHEYANNEEPEKAMAIYRKAMAINSRSYLVWSGLATVYMKQEQYAISEAHWRKAIILNSENPSLLVHLGVSLHQQHKAIEAIKVLSKAILIEPKFALAKFHRATAYLALDRCHEALQDLQDLRDIAPHESMVYYLLGKVYKKLGKEHLALMNLSRATDMDPRGAYTQIKESLDPVNRSGDQTERPDVLNLTPEARELQFSFETETERDSFLPNETELTMESDDSF